jgi:hypothetical protein
VLQWGSGKCHNCAASPARFKWKASKQASEQASKQASKQASEQASPCSFNWAPRQEGILGSGGTDPRFLDLDSRWKWVVSFTPRPLYPEGKSLCHPLDNREGGPQSRSERGGEEESFQPLPGLEPPIIQPVAQRYTTKTSRMKYSYNAVYVFRPVCIIVWDCFAGELYVKLCIFNFVIRRRWVVRFKPWPLYPRGNCAPPPPLLGGL